MTDEVERDFSRVKLTLDSHQSHMKITTLERLCVTRAWKRWLWKQQEQEERGGNTVEEWVTGI